MLLRYFLSTVVLNWLFLKNGIFIFNTKKKKTHIMSNVFCVLNDRQYFQDKRYEFYDL